MCCSHESENRLVAKEIRKRAMSMERRRVVREGTMKFIRDKRKGELILLERRLNRKDDYTHTDYQLMINY